MAEVPTEIRPGDGLKVVTRSDGWTADVGDRSGQIKAKRWCVQMLDLARGTDNNQKLANCRPLRTRNVADLPIPWSRAKSTVGVVGAKFSDGSVFEEDESQRRCNRSEGEDEGWREGGMWRMLCFLSQQSYSTVSPLHQQQSTFPSPQSRVTAPIPTDL